MNNYWGLYSADCCPEERFDPLQTFKASDKFFGFRVIITTSRRNRPREYQRENIENIKVVEKDSIFKKISSGELECIPISGDESIILSGFKPEYHNLTKYMGVTIINKYSPLCVLSENSNTAGIAVVSYSNKYSENLDDEDALASIFRSLITTLKYFKSKYNSSIVFFNVGRTSGASIRQLHAQAYLTNSIHGSLSYSYYQSYDMYKKDNRCLTCDLANKNTVVDKLEQKIDLEKLILWEDDYIRLVHPFAPIRPLSLRIIPKRHVNSLIMLNDREIKSLSRAMIIAHTAVSEYPINWRRKKDHSIAVRQSINYDVDFHMIIDILSTIPMGGSEIVDFVSISSFDPMEVARIMREIINTKY